MQLPYSSVFSKLARGFDPRSPRAVDGFPSLHPIMRVKGWLDRRLEKRTRVRIPATLTLNGVSQSVIITDTSRSGVGLSQTSGLRQGDHVEIFAVEGPKRNGIVVWTKQDWAGVSLAD